METTMIDNNYKSKYNHIAELEVKNIYYIIYICMLYIIQYI